VIPGFATPAGTAAYRARLGPAAAAGHFRSWQGIELSSVGLGTYLGADDDATDGQYVDAIRRALELGVNVVDAAINYRHQRSERSIGAALRRPIEAGRLRREEVCLTTKGGFSAASQMDQYVRSGIVPPEDVVGGIHAMTPRFLAAQLDLSRANLGVETVDVYYLHNPEMQLSEVDRPTFWRRLRDAFGFLEGAVSDGKIRCYGTATWNGYRQPPEAPDFLSLPEVAGIAAEAGGAAHHFRVIQLPYNLAMTEAFTRVNQTMDGEPVSALEAARRLGIYVMTSASIYQGQLTRNLPAVISEFLPGLDTDAQRALQFVRSTPNVGTALVGMKQRAHVQENARVVSIPPIPWEQFQKLFAEG